MKTNKILSVILAIAMIMGTLGTVVFAEETAQTEALATTEKTLNEIVAEADVGDTIKLSGVYTLNEMLHIEESITLTSEDADAPATIIVTGTSNYVVAHAADGITFENLIFKADDTFVGENKSSLDPNNASGKKSVLCAYGKVTVNNCSFINEGSAVRAIFLNNAKGSKLTNMNSAGSTVSGCIFNNFSIAIASMEDNDPMNVTTVKDNTFNQVDEAINFYWGKIEEETSTKIVITGNTFNSTISGSAMEVNVWNYALKKGSTLKADLTFTGNNAQTPVDFIYKDFVKEADVTVQTDDENINNIKTFSSMEFAANNVQDNDVFYMNYGGASTEKYIVENGTIGAPITYVASVNGTYYDTFSDAIEKADENATITLLAPVTLTEELILSKSLKFDGADLTTDGFLTIANGVSLEGENIKGTVYAEADATVNVNMPNAELTLNGSITFNGDNNVYYLNCGSNNVINIVNGATLKYCNTSRRMTIGYNNTFNIIGNIDDAESASTVGLKPSLQAAGASITGGIGAKFNVTNAYIDFTNYVSTSYKVADGTFIFNVENSIWTVSGGKLAFEEPKENLNPEIKFNLKDSVLNTSGHLVFSVKNSEVIFDNSYVNYASYKQLENRGNLTIKNGSVVYASPATSSNAKNPGNLIVDNSQYIANGELSGSDLGIGTLILKNNADVSLKDISKIDVTTDASSTLTISGNVKDDVTFTITADNLSNKKVLDLNETASREGKVTVPELSDNVDIIYGEDGDVSFKINIASIGETKYTSFEDAIKAANENAGSDTIVLLTDVTPSRFTLSDGDVLDLNDKTMYLNVENSYANNSTIKNGNVVIGKDNDVNDGHFIINDGKTFVVSDVAFTSSEDGYDAWSLFSPKGNAKLILNENTNINLKNNSYSGSIVYCNDLSPVIEATDVTIKGENVGRGFVYGSFTYTDSTVEVIGTTDDGLEHGFNGSNLTLNDTDVTISGGCGRGITLSRVGTSHAVINGTSTVVVTDMDEAGIKFGDDEATLTVAETASIYVETIIGSDNKDLDLANSEQVVGDVTILADNAAIELVPVTATRTNDNVKLYNIVLKGELGHDIYEFIAAELTFENKSHTTGEPGSMKYIVTANDDEKLVLVENADKPAMYGFHIADDADKITKPEIILGQVEFVGNGTVDFKVTDALITATVYETNDELYYSSKANATNKVDITAATASGALDFATYTNLNVNLDFIHDTTSGNTAAYNGMTITVTGPLGYKKVGKIGKDANGADVFADAVNNKATLTFEDVVVGYRYTVKLEAPGYRTYTYATTIEKENPALRFWNDAKRGTDIDPKISIEDGKTETDVTFLVGDIAMDYIVDKYDLAAVTSYYGTYGVTNGNLIKYDLNRDGNIDILDIGYVIHGLGY